MVYYVGIIDILQQYTFKKRAARLMKKYTIGWATRLASLSGAHFPCCLRCFHEIDTEPPEYYRNRFVKYLDEKFVPLSDADLSKKHAEVPEVQSFLMSQAIRENQSEGCQRTVKWIIWIRSILLAATSMCMKITIGQSVAHIQPVFSCIISQRSLQVADM